MPKFNVDSFTEYNVFCTVPSSWDPSPLGYILTGETTHRWYPERGIRVSNGVYHSLGKTPSQEGLDEHIR